LTLLSDSAATSRLAAVVDELAAVAARIESELDDGASGLSVVELETVNAALIRVKDALWAIGRDRIRAAREVAALMPSDTDPAGLAVLFSLYQALSAVDRLEVRSRDSAGVEVQLVGHGIADDDPLLRRALADRSHRGFTSGDARLHDGTLVLVYTTSAEIGELGDNTASLRAAIRDDELLHLALRSAEVEGVVLGHTRWASIGIISEPNAHPQSSDELDGANRPFCTAVLNGDVDNYADLIASDGLKIPAEITTDAKVIPTLFSRQLDAGLPVAESFRETVVRLVGSVAIAATTAAMPDRLTLALRGSGQALYVGVAEDAFIVASEPYGVVEETATFLRMDGETP
jgi:glucosamine--fructose-6-phosphate aminotransferase (isomerizing)